LDVRVVVEVEVVVRGLELLKAEPRCWGGTDVRGCWPRRN
jgi:hypothetical protein